MPFASTWESAAKFAPLNVTLYVPIANVEGDTLHSHGYGRVTVSAAVPTCAGNAVLFADTVTVFAAGMTDGGLYSPVGLMVPTVASPPGMLFTIQVIVLGEIGTYAVYCSVLVTSSVEVVGYTAICPET